RRQMGLEHHWVQVSARGHYEKILPLISDGKLLNENLAKLESFPLSQHIRRKLQNHK
uniref:Uncharacterized protein n=1 Tax=Moschus moschiferus TaxID=68415 RepID=A0A8C6DTF2_MOSMO